MRSPRQLIADAIRENVRIVQHTGHMPGHYLTDIDKAVDAILPMIVPHSANAAGPYTPILSQGDEDRAGFGLKALAADTENKRVLKVFFDHEVTIRDRLNILDAFNALKRERPSASGSSSPTPGEKR